ncbi:MAG: helix-turn-helix domain-containing protein [Deltaproteobacteria bacterium]|nr:helix-turn-helix domain-containing protein [Deltaproteobacteria bacterium]
MQSEALEAAGLSRNEAQIYLSLVESGRLTAHTLSKRLKLPRSTVYSVLNVLEERRLLRREEVKGTFWFRVDNPDDLVRSIEEEERALALRKHAASRLAAELKKIHRSKSYQVPKIEFFEGKDRVERFLFANLPRWTESILERDRSTWGFQDHTFVSEFGEWIGKAWKVMHDDNKIAGRLLSNRSQVERALKNKVVRREVRVLGNEFNFESSIWVLGDFVVLILTRETPIIAFQINNQTLASNLRVVFRALYDAAGTLD